MIRVVVPDLWRCSCIEKGGNSVIIRGSLKLIMAEARYRGTNRIAVGKGVFSLTPHTSQAPAGSGTNELRLA